MGGYSGDDDVLLSPKHQQEAWTAGRVLRVLATHKAQTSTPSYLLRTSGGTF